MGTIASQITRPTIAYSTVYSDADQRKHQSSAPLAFVRGIHRGLVNSPHKWPVTRKMLPFDDVIMYFDLEQDDTDLLRLETFGSWWFSENYTMSVQTPSGDIISTINPEIGRYTVTFEYDDYFEDISLFDVTAEHVLEDSFIWVNSTTSGSFSLPQDVVDIGRTVRIRVEATGESDTAPAGFAISYEEEMDVSNGDAQIMSAPPKRGNKLVSEILICKPQVGVYNYQMVI